MKIGHLAIALLSITHLANAAWTVQTVDSGVAVGRACSLVLGAQGVPHIAYYRPHPSDNSFADLYYATISGSSWSTESIYDGFSFGGAGEVTSIALTDLGNPAVTFSRATSFLAYSIRSSGTWTTNSNIRTDAGGFSSLLWHGTEASPQPVAAYYDSAGTDLKYAYFTGAWNASTLDNTGDSGKYCSMAQVGSYMGIAYVDVGKLGFYESFNDGTNWGPYSDNAFAPFNTITGVSACALALAPAVNSASTNVRAHIIYYDGTAARFYYVTNDTSNGAWKAKELIQQTSLNTVGSVGVSIAVGTDGVPQVAFLDYNTNRLVYSKRTASGWTTPEPVDGSNLGGANCSLKLDASNQPKIAFGGITFDSGSSTYVVSSLKFASIASPSSGGTTPPSFSITGKKKRTATAAKLAIKGTASANAVAVRWKVGKKSFKKAAVSGGKWTAKVGPLVAGKNKVIFQAISSSGVLSPNQTLTITKE